MKLSILDPFLSGRVLTYKELFIYPRETQLCAVHPVLI